MENSPVPVEQLDEEFLPFLEYCKSKQVKSVLEIGSRFGGTLWAWLKILKVELAVAIDWPLEGDLNIRVQREQQWHSWKSESQALEIITARSESSNAKQAVKEAMARYNLSMFDLVFIDGGHKYEEVSQDFHSYNTLGRIIALHDITPSTRIAEADYAVPKFWNEIKGTNFKEFVFKREPPDGYGIGVLTR